MLGRYRLLVVHTINNIRCLPGHEFYVDTQHGNDLVSRGTAERLDDVRPAPKLVTKQAPLLAQQFPKKRGCCGGWGKRK